MKAFCTLIVFLSTCVAYGQVSRIVAKGIIKAPLESEVEGIALYNDTTNKGIVTDANGEFTLAIALNDRIVVSALQYTTFTVTVDQKMVDEKRIDIYLNPTINELGEVVISKTDLTGNLKVDAEEIQTFTLDPNAEWDLSWETINNDYTFTDDRSSSIRGNASNDALFGQSGRYRGLDILGGITLLVDMIGGNKKKVRLPPKMDQKTLIANLKKRYPENDIIVTFGIPENKVGDFLFFVAENGLTQGMLETEREMQLLDFLFEKAKAYKKQIEG